jgi:hypothetical protein
VDAAEREVSRSVGVDTAPLALGQPQRRLVAKPPYDRTAVPPRLSSITCLKLAAWKELLRDYPEEVLRDSILDGIANGFDIGYRGTRDSSICRQVSNHSIDSEEEIAFVSADMAKEVGLGRRAGPFSSPPFPNFLVSPMGVVRKRFSSKLRLVHDYSFHGSTPGSAVNASIPEEFRETKLSSFDAAIDMILSVKRSSPATALFLSKIDIQSAYRLVPVRPSDYHLLGMSWQRQYYFDMVTPFGLASSCQIWERIATAAEWIIKTHLGISLLLHYMDDYLLVSTTETLGEAQMKYILAVFEKLGLPVSVDKLEGPVSRIIFLGIGIDAVNNCVYLDEQRMAYLKSTLDSWASRSTATIKELQSLTGLLNFCCRVIRPGRTFLRRIINYTSHIMTKTSNPNKPVAISQSVRADVRWWNRFLTTFNGTLSIFPTAFEKGMELGHPWLVATDASCSGYGATFGHRWLHGMWTEEQEKASRQEDTLRDSMPYKELTAVVIAASTWGHLWTHKNITFKVDCEPVVFAMTKGDSKRPRMMDHLRTLAYLAISHEFNYRIEHIPGHLNVLADPLSRQRIDDFHTQCLSLQLFFNPSACQALPPPSHNW